MNLLYYTLILILFFIDKPLPVELIDSKKLGFMKLESEYQFFCSIGPKCWIGVTESGDEVCKVKGSKYKIQYLDFINLLNEESSLNLNHTKWFKLFKDSTIRIKDTTYNLKSTCFKRVLVYQNRIRVIRVELTISSWKEDDITT